MRSDSSSFPGVFPCSVYCMIMFHLAVCKAFQQFSDCSFRLKRSSVYFRSVGVTVNLVLCGILCVFWLPGECWPPGWLAGRKTASLLFRLRSVSFSLVQIMSCSSLNVNFLFEVA